MGGGSYLSACDGRLHFGLGASTSVDSVEVRWPSGRLDRWTDLAADTGYRLREGDRPPSPWPVSGPGPEGVFGVGDARPDPGCPIASPAFSPQPFMPPCGTCYDSQFEPPQDLFDGPELRG